MDAPYFTVLYARTSIKYLSVIPGKKALIGLLRIVLEIWDGLDWKGP